MIRFLFIINIGSGFTFSNMFYVLCVYVYILYFITLQSVTMMTVWCSIYSRIRIYLLQLISCLNLTIRRQHLAS